MNLPKEALSSINFKLAEGPMYYDEAYYWVDIKARSLFKFKGGKVESLVVESDYLTSVVAHAKGSLIVSGKNNLMLIEDMQTCVPLELEFDLPEEVRFNDAKVDPWGNYWIGTMDLNFDKPIGALYCIYGKGKLKKVLDGIICSNGMIWNEEEKVFYYIDSKTQNVTSYQFDPDTVTLSSMKVIYHDIRPDVYPDGMTIDTEGFLYVALWGGSEVIKLNPHNGEIKERYSLPCPNVTSCCFAGEELNELMVTTASEDCDIKEYPSAGQVFKFETESKGLETKELKHY